MAAFAERLQSLIDERGLSRAEFARQVGISKSLPTIWGRGVVLPMAPIQERVAGYFGVSIDYLMGRTDDRQQAQVSVPVIGMASVGRDVGSTQRTEPTSDTKAGASYVWVENPDDSMHPRLERGDLLLVQIGAELPSGAIGIVIVDGMAYVRCVECTDVGIALRGGAGIPSVGYYGDERERVRLYGRVVQVRRKLA